MTGEGPLAQGIAALVLRDIPEVFARHAGSFCDRAAVIEDAWAETVPDAFGAGAGDRPFSEVGYVVGGLVTARYLLVILVGTSVTDGCRVLVTNVGGLPSSEDRCSTDPLSHSDATLGAIPASVDVLSGLLPKSGRGQQQTGG